MRKSKLLYFTLAVTIAYCSLCFISAGSILYGAYNSNLSVFDFGNKILLFWMVNPLGLILPIVGLIKSRPKWFYVLCMILTIVSWLVAGAMVASVF